MKRRALVVLAILAVLVLFLVVAGIAKTIRSDIAEADRCCNFLCTAYGHEQGVMRWSEASCDCEAHR